MKLKYKGDGAAYLRHSLHRKIDILSARVRIDKQKAVNWKQDESCVRSAEIEESVRLISSQSDFIYLFLYKSYKVLGGPVSNED